MSAAFLRQRGPLGCLVATVLLATACGGSSSSGAAASTTSGGSTSNASAATTSAATTSPAAATSSAGSAAGTSATSAGSAAAPTSTAAVVLSAAPVTSVKATGGGTFCKDLAAAINNESTSATGSTPADLKKSIQASQQVGLLALSKAPSAIKADVKVLIDASAQFAAALAKANYDITKLSPAAEAAFSTPAVTQAEARVATFVKADCGIDVSGGGAAAPSS